MQAHLHHRLRRHIGSGLVLLALAACGAGTSTPDSTATPAKMGGRLLGGAPVVNSTFSGNLSQYTISSANLTVTDNVSGAVQAVPANALLKFADTTVSLDIDGIPGQTYRLYQAAFNRKPDLPGLGAQINGMNNGLSLEQISQNFIDSAEFSKTYGALNNVDFVTLLYNNVLKRAPEPAGLAFHVGNLEGTNPGGRVLSRAIVLFGFSESAENKALVLDAIKNGIEFVPFGTSAPSNPASDFAGAFTGSIRGDDSGTLTLTVDAGGALTGAFHSNAFNVDMSGTGSIAAGGRFAITLSGGGHSFDFTGSFNLASGLATGAWNVTGVPTVGGVFNASKPATPTGPTFSTVQAIVMQRCVPCHSANPTMPGFNPAPLGIHYDTEAQIRGSIADIKQYAVSSKIMPYANMTGMTDAERATIGAWITAGTP
jgi:mono/diheme cytochrome c family protein